MLSRKQEQILNFIRNYPHPYPPTVREIGKGVGISSSSTVHHHLHILEQQGYITHESKRPRTIRIIK